MKIGYWRRELNDELGWLEQQTKPVVDGVKVKERMEEIKKVLEKYKDKHPDDEVPSC